LTKAVAFYPEGFLCNSAASWNYVCTCSQIAVNYDIPVIFDLSDPLLVKNHKKVLLEWIQRTVTLLIGNRYEIYALTGCSRDQDALKAASNLSPIVIMKIGSDGVVVIENTEWEVVPTKPVVAQDTTGAGDAFTAGFLFRWLAGADPVVSAKLGNQIAGAITKVDGCNYRNISADMLTN
jgi:sugar/nucleoside kinase (ribokinase family)